MTLEGSVRLVAGSLVLISLLIYYYISPWGLALAVFVGLNLIQSSFTKFCPAEILFKKLFFSK